MNISVQEFVIFTISLILFMSSGLISTVNAESNIVEIIDSTGADGKLLRGPYQIAVDTLGNAYVASYYIPNAFKITPDGTKTQIINENKHTLRAPSAIAVDSKENVYVAALNGHIVIKVTPDGIKTQIIDRYADGIHLLNTPTEITVDSKGNVYVSGYTSNNAFKITTNGIITQIIDQNGDGIHPLTGSSAITTDSKGNVYVSGYTSNNAFKITTNGIITQIIDQNGDGIHPLTGSSAITTDSKGNVYVSGKDSHNAFKITPDGTITQIISDTGDGIYPLYNPSAIAVDSAGYIYVVGSGSNNAFKITTNGIITQIISDTGDGIHPLDTPSGVAVDSAGNVYVSGKSSNNVFKITPTGTTTQIISADTHYLLSPHKIAVDSTGNVFVAGFDSNNAFKILADETKTQIIPSDDSATKTDTSSATKTDTSSATSSKPTFGVDHKSFKQTVDGGFTFNAKSFDVTDNFHTPFEKQIINIGDTNTFSAKVYAEKQLRVQEFLFGIPEVGQAQDAELDIEVFYDSNGNVELINVVQKTDVIDVDSLVVIHQKSLCQVSDKKENCDTTYLSMKFLEPLQDDVMAIKAIDFKNRFIITYLNDGFDISGDSLNPMNTKMIPGTEKYEGLVKVTQTGKYSDIWIAEDGREFEMNDYGTFTQINKVYDTPVDEFAAYKQAQVEIAMQELLTICPDCLDSYADFEDSWESEMPETYASKYDDPKIQLILLEEEKRAQQFLD